MDTAIQKIRAIFANEELKKKLIFTATIFLIFRLFAHIPVPGVNVAQLQQLFAGNQFLSLLNIFAGGTLSRFSIVAVGINPYITASIIMQLAGMVFPKLKEMQKEDGEAGRAKINQYTRLLSVPFALVQSISVIALLRSQNLLTAATPTVLIAMVLTMVAGAMIMLWLGELVSEYGLGNGISMVLFAGIVSQIPVAVSQTLSVVTSTEAMTLIVFVLMFVALIAMIVYINEAVRKVNIQYAKRTRGGKTYGGQTTHLPIKVNVAGVMPIIFAVSLMMAPSFIGKVLTSSGNLQFVAWGQNLTRWFQETSPIYLISYFLLVFSFTFFSALIFFNAQDISDELKKSGAFVPGIRPGGPTKKFLEYVVVRITLVGAVFLGILALLPSIAQMLTGVQSLAIGGTSVLIVVSVILETTKQAESMLVGQDYDKYQ
ncbi:MAG: preprotein translocase subunit SecY [Candidatus Pacebacteria bacterium CG10_big_fil_rev_8_21_14_0_10_36_11]|nr:preprotein translocase subunit SecY [Candidatus Pacearchaeota archaeon]PIR65042.1 MAG: preprotein translocase subunit SecY [Candidatus Pacebacteria bacterium CG10_big_fil_rev_8_21_14_0_10_36_11]PJC42858.1 MAG: preprotein translocase subunit SecY [Candidatus Pacebacteria bacterium CG_4_9_14_0_2_um_filter_36_8]